MLGQHFATILARTDPFDLAQALERYIRSLNGQEVRALIVAASPRMSDWYRTEFRSLLDERDGERLKAAFAHTLKSNLRAIPLFGANFCEGVIAQVPSDRTIALGDDTSALPRVRPLAIAIVAAAIFIAGAAAQHVINTAQANARGPVVLATPAPLPTATPAQPHVAAAARVVSPAKTAAPQTPAPPAHREQHVALTPPVQVAPPPPVPGPTPAPRIAAPPPAPHRSPPHGSGVKTVVAQEHQLPTAEPTALDVSDMPRSYSDATPLPINQTPPAVDVPAQSVATPVSTAAPSRGSWLHRTIMHLDPLKPNTGGWIYNSVKHLDPFKPHPKPSPTATATGGPQQ